jgi:hypothetical protein
MDAAAESLFTVVNIGQGTAGSFRIVVLAAAQFFSIHVGGLAAGQQAT